MSYYYAKVIADSICEGVRLTTMEVQFPRFILAEFNTHRMFSRNSASSRAIPVEKRIEQVRTNPFVPEAFGKNKSGMQASETLAEEQNEMARALWLAASRSAADMAELLARVKVHKQHANRVIENYAWHTCVVSSTEWANFFALRCHPAAQPEMQIVAHLMRDAMAASTPRPRHVGAWHLPYIDRNEDDSINDRDLKLAYEIAKLDVGIGGEDADALDALVRISTIRCAAVSFERQYAERTVENYRERYSQMRSGGHWSPFEHPAKASRLSKQTAEGEDRFIGNFRAPWVQHRKQHPGESLFHGGA